MAWVRFLSGRLLAAALTLVVLSVLVFAATAVLPGDAAGGLAGPDATEADRARIRAELGLDRPAFTRYLDWVGGAVRGDLGRAWVGGRPVADLLTDRVPDSLLLVAPTLLLVAPLGAALGLLAGLRAGRGTDRAVGLGAALVVAVPEFLAAALLAGIVGGLLGWLPAVSLVPLGASPLADPRVLVLPVLALSTVGLATTTRLVRASAARVATSPYIEAARLSGVGGLRLAVRHVLPNAAGPAVAGLAVVAAGLVGATVVVESVFNYPGIGRELVQAVTRRDVPVVQGISLTLAALALAALLAGDVLRRLLEPTVRR